MRRLMKRAGMILSAVFLVFSIALPAVACVGKTLVIGHTGTPQQEVLAQTIALLISERTGTTAKVVRFDSASSAHEALRKADLDIVVEYTGVAQAQVLKGAAIADAEALLRQVKESYNQDLNLIWLTPFGFDEPSVAPPGMKAQAAPVVRKDTLKKFPALARLINKLGGAINAEQMHDLETAAVKKSPQEAARTFLKAGKFI